MVMQALAQIALWQATHLNRIQLLKKLSFFCAERCPIIDTTTHKLKYILGYVVSGELGSQYGTYCLLFIELGIES